MSFFIEPENIQKFGELCVMNKYCVIDFYANWCGPCKMLTNELPIKVQKSGIDLRDVIFMKIDIDRLPDIAKVYDVEKIPHIIFYKHGMLQSKYIRGNKPDEIIEEVKKMIRDK